MTTMIKRRFFHCAWLCAAAAALAGAPCLAGQQRPVQSTNPLSVVNPPSATPLPTPELVVPNTLQPDLVSPAAPANYVIGDNDLLSVFVYQMPEMTRQVRVSAAGTIQIPFARRAFAASGQTALRLQQDIAADLVAEGLVRTPVVQVTVLQVESKPIVVGGAVQRPEVLQASRPMRLLEVLSSAGGLTTESGDTVLVTENGNTASTVSHAYSLADLLRYNKAEDDPLLFGNDMVTVLPARMVYVVGDFKKPGAFPITMGEPITVVRAVALAQGLDQNPNRGHAIIISTAPDGTQKRVSIRLDRILDHKAPDVALQAGDILYVSKNEKEALALNGLTDLGQLLTLGVAYHFP